MNLYVYGVDVIQQVSSSLLSIQQNTVVAETLLSFQNIPTHHPSKPTINVPLSRTHTHRYWNNKYHLLIMRIAVGRFNGNQPFQYLSVFVFLSFVTFGD